MQVAVWLRSGLSGPCLNTWYSGTPLRRVKKVKVKVYPVTLSVTGERRLDLLGPWNYEEQCAVQERKQPVSVQCGLQLNLACQANFPPDFFYFF